MANESPEVEKPQVHWTERMLDLYGEGRSDVEVCKELKITRKQFEGYMESTPAFRELVERGRDYAEAWWLSKSREALFNKDFMTANWQFNMVNRYGWSSKREAKDLDPGLNLDKAKEELRKKLPELTKMLNVTELNLDVSRKVVAGG